MLDIVLSDLRREGDSTMLKEYKAYKWSRQQFLSCSEKNLLSLYTAKN